jgi:hypothetical protein
LLGPVQTAQCRLGSGAAQQHAWRSGARKIAEYFASLSYHPKKLNKCIANLGIYYL